MQLRVLGPVDLHDGHQRVPLPGNRLPRLLATLAAQPDRAVDVGVLADAIWSGAPPPTAGGAIHMAVSQARRLLAAGGEPGPGIVTEPGGYRLTATTTQLDLLAFVDLLDAARRCAREGRPAARADCLERSLALWRGEPFGALDDAGTVAAEGRRLHELRLDAEEDLCATQVQLGRDREVLVTIAGLLEAHPFRERLIGLQMLALYRAGRPVDALSAYEHFRRRLRDELGVQPGNELRRLERLVLLQHPSLDLSVAADDPPPADVRSVAVYSSIDPLSNATPKRHPDVGAAIDEWTTITSATGNSHATGFGISAASAEAELLALASPPGRVLVDAIVARELRARGSVVDLGEHRLADLGRPRRVFEWSPKANVNGTDPIRSCSSVPTVLGSELTAFVGRRALRARVAELIGEGRVVSLVGPPGAGKTRLARRVAAENAWAFPGGAWFVELGSVSLAEDLVRALTSALHVTVRSGADQPGELRRRLQLRTLVVLDNAEHLAVALAPLLASISAGAPTSVFVVTSRRRTAVDGEMVVPVGPLVDTAAGPECEHQAGLADAVAILRSRLIDLGGTAIGDDEARALVERVDGLPLAVELVAAQVATLGATTVLERLDQVLVGDALSTALRTSEQLLTDVDRTVLRRMAAFAGPVDIHAAEAVVPDVTVPVAEVAPALGRLVEASLLGLVEVAGRTRFRMLAAIRSVAGQRLADAGEAADVADRHADWASRSGWKLAGALVGRDPARARSEIDSMLPDLRAALTHLEAGDDRDRHIFAVAGLWFFWYFTGRLHEGRAVTLAAVRRPGGRPAQRALGLAAAANLAWWQCDYREARRCLAEARAVPGVPDELAFFEIVNGALAWIEGDLDAAATNLSAALARARTTGRFDLPMAAAMSGNVAWWRGDHATSEALYREGREASAAARNAFTAALCARHEALQLGLQGRVAEARLLVHHALAECRRLGDVMGIGQSLVYAGLIELVADERERAAALLTEGVRTAVGPGDLFCLVVAAPSMAGLLADNGDVVGAARWLGWREATMTRAGMVPSAAQQAACDLLGEQIAGVLGQDARLHRAEGEAFTLDDLSASIADL